MKIAHRYNWHYAPPIYPEGDTMLWCKWCGFREVTKRKNHNSLGEIAKEAEKLKSNP